MIELSFADAIAFVSLVETGRADDARLVRGGAVDGVPLPALVEYFGPFKLLGFKTFDKKKNETKAAMKLSEKETRTAVLLEPPAGFTPTGRITLADLTSAIDPKSIAYRSPELAKHVAFLYEGAPASDADRTEAQKIFAKVKPDAIVGVSAKPKLRCLPDDLSAFATTTRFMVDNSGLRVIGPSIAQLTNVEELAFQWCALSFVDPAIGSLKKLHSITIEGGTLEKLPESIADLPLAKLTLMSCANLAELPESLLEVRTLKRLWLRGTPASKHERTAAIIANNPGVDVVS